MERKITPQSFLISLPSFATSREVQFYSQDHSHPKRNFIISFEEKGVLAVA